MPQATHAIRQNCVKLNGSGSDTMIDHCDIAAEALLLPSKRWKNQMPDSQPHLSQRAQNLRDQSAGQRSTTTLVWVKNSTACLPWPCSTPKKLRRQPENGK